MDSIKAISVRDDFLLGDYERNWQEDFSEKNGNYLNKCSECGELFVGNKRRVVCKKCSFAIEVKREVERRLTDMFQSGCLPGYVKK
jgi:DNA-directed RNA polymerase subunit RPC12/RpoP